MDENDKERGKNCLACFQSTIDLVTNYSRCKDGLGGYPAKRMHPAEKAIYLCTYTYTYIFSLLFKWRGLEGKVNSIRLIFFPFLYQGCARSLVPIPDGSPSLFHRVECEWETCPSQWSICCLILLYFLPFFTLSCLCVYFFLVEISLLRDRKCVTCVCVCVGGGEGGSGWIV